MILLHRNNFHDQIKNSFNVNPICAILGPRQCGKTTLAREFVSQQEDEFRFFDLEDPEDYHVMQNPKLVLDKLEFNIVIDAVQRIPELFPYLRTLVDKKPWIKILILGSASGELLRQSSESLAGRITTLELTPFTLEEVGDAQRLMLRGGFPKSFLAKNDAISFAWRQEYINTYLEKDIPGLGLRLHPSRLRRFWMMLTDYHGNLLNISELGRNLEIDSKTARHYLDILLHTFMIREVLPWFENVSKRQIKTSKIYFRDPGIFHALRVIDSNSSLINSSKIGASWEGFAFEQIIRINNASDKEVFFWASATGAEVDLLIVRGDKKFAFELKYSSTPKITKSMIAAIETLKLEKMTIIVPGNSRYYLAENIEAVGIEVYKKEL